MANMRKITNEPVVGSYGTPSVPVFLVDGEEIVGEEYFLDESGPIRTVCQSAGCDYCYGEFESCRYNSINKGLQTAWFVVSRI